MNTHRSERGTVLILSDRLGFSLPTATCTDRPPLLDTAGGGVLISPHFLFSSKNRPLQRPAPNPPLPHLYRAI